MNEWMHECTCGSTMHDGQSWVLLPHVVKQTRKPRAIHQAVLSFVFFVSLIGSLVFLSKQYHECSLNEIIYYTVLVEIMN